MSANSAVTVLRSPSIVSEVCSSDPMRTPSAAFAAEGLPPSATTSVPSALPQSAQNFSPGIASVPHFEQRILCSQLVEQRLGILQIGGIEALGEPAIDSG